MNLAYLLIASMLAPAVSAELPLYEQEPFDRLTLNAANDRAVLEVEPLDLPGRRVPEKPKPGERLRVRLLTRPGVDYDVPWQAIDKVELFEHMVLAEAERLVAEGNLEEAYDYFAFLERTDDELPGLAEAMETYLYEEAKAAHRAGEFDRALAMLRETYRRHPEREGLDKAMGLATGKLIDEFAAQANYAAIRALIANLAACFPGHEVANQWVAQLKEQAHELLLAARTAVSDGRIAEASRLCRNVTAIWPELPGARELAEEVHRRYPRMVVAVAELSANLEGRSTFRPGDDSRRKTPQADTKDVPHCEPSSLIDWSARRTARLRYRTLLELTAPGTEGGQYACPLGRFATEELGRRLVFELRPEMAGSNGSAARTGYDVSRQLLRLAEGGGAAYSWAWADLMAGVSVSDVYRVEVDLRRVHVRPERLLQTAVPPMSWLGPPAPMPSNGPYEPSNSEEGQAVYSANAQYPGRQPGQPAEIVERRMEPFQAIASLRAGTVDLVDRVVPWMLAELREEASRPNASVIIEPYAFPMVHCLVPSSAGGLTSRRSFRRALVYGIDRERILDRLLAHHDLPGYEVADGPFPRGYARDPEVAPRPYDPHLATALAAVARRELASLAASEAAEVDAETDPGNAALRDAGASLVLAHPANPVAHAACNLIQRHLEIVGIDVALHQLTAGETAAAEQGRFPKYVDLLYVELAAWEPVADAARLFGHGGLCSRGSCYVQLGLRRLADAADWPAARSALSSIHRAVYDEVSVIPLWQLTEHFAYRTDLEGISAQPVTLYQDVERWRPTFRFVAP